MTALIRIACPALLPAVCCLLSGVAAGDADCVVFSNYRFSNIAKQCEKMHLTTVCTDADMDCCPAVRDKRKYLDCKTGVSQSN